MKSILIALSIFISFTTMANNLDEKIAKVKNCNKVKCTEKQELDVTNQMWGILMTAVNKKDVECSKISVKAQLSKNIDEKKLLIKSLRTCVEEADTNRFAAVEACASKLVIMKNVCNRLRGDGRMPASNYRVLQSLSVYEK